MKKTIFSLILIASATLMVAQTQFIKTGQLFENSEAVYSIKHQGKIVGEWWPVKIGLKLITKESHPDVFSREMPLEQILNREIGFAIAPDGMTSSLSGGYEVEGDYIIDGKRYGTGKYPNYGIIVLNKKGSMITFTHKIEWGTDIDLLFDDKSGNPESSVFFLPSIKRGSVQLNSENSYVHRALVRRNTYAGEQVGIVVFSSIVSYRQALEVFAGLDQRSRGAAETTHIYYLDGGSIWGQVARKTNGQVTTIGSRKAEKVTNYLIAY